MKIRTDENVAPLLTEILKKTATGRGVELTSIYDAGQRGYGDESWVRAFADLGGEAVVSGDKDFIKRSSLIVCVHDLGLRVAVLPPSWQQLKLRQQAIRLLQWWPRLEHVLADGVPGSFYQVKNQKGETPAIFPKPIDMGRHRRTRSR